MFCPDVKFRKFLGIKYDIVSKSMEIIFFYQQATIYSY